MSALQLQISTVDVSSEMAIGRKAIASKRKYWFLNRNELTPELSKVLFVLLAARHLQLRDLQATPQRAQWREEGSSRPVGVHTFTQYTPSVVTVIVLLLVDVPHYTTRVRGYMVGSEMG